MPAEFLQAFFLSAVACLMYGEGDEYRSAHNMNPLSSALKYSLFDF